jgi:hypothetical protein
VLSPVRPTVHSAVKRRFIGPWDSGGSQVSEGGPNRNSGDDYEENILGQKNTIRAEMAKGGSQSEQLPPAHSMVHHPGRE